MKILVTGASGNVGCHVVNELLKMGEKVKAAGTDPDKLRSLFKNEVEAVKFDFTRTESFDEALREVDRVFLMRPPHLGKSKDLYPFIDAMKKQGIQLVSFLSLMGIEHNPIPPHYKIEKYIEKSSIPYAHIRPGFFMQNVSGIHALEIKEQGKIFIPAGKSKTSFIDAEDIGLSAAILLHHPKKYRNTAHTLTGSEALDYYQVADILSKVTSKKVVYSKPGYLKYRNYYIRKRNLDKAYINVTVALYFMTRMGTAEEVTNGFHQLTGKDPKTFEAFAWEHKNEFVR